MIYTRVSIKHAKAVHDMTHPAAKVKRGKKAAAVQGKATEADLLATLEAEAGDEDDANDA